MFLLSFFESDEDKTTKQTCQETANKCFGAEINTVQPHFDRLAKMIRSSNDVAIKQVVGRIKSTIKSEEIAPRKKYFAINLLKELMKIRTLALGDYVVEKILQRLTILAQHRKEVKHIDSRGRDIFGTVSAEQAEWSSKFLKLLLQLLDQWAREWPKGPTLQAFRQARSDLSKLGVTFPKQNQDSRQARSLSPVQTSQISQRPSVTKTPQLQSTIENRPSSAEIVEFLKTCRDSLDLLSDSWVEASPGDLGFLRDMSTGIASSHSVKSDELLIRLGMDSRDPDTLAIRSFNEYLTKLKKQAKPGVKDFPQLKERHRNELREILQSINQRITVLDKSNKPRLSEDSIPIKQPNAQVPDALQTNRYNSTNSLKRQLEQYNRQREESNNANSKKNQTSFEGRENYEVQSDKKKPQSAIRQITKEQQQSAIRSNQQRVSSQTVAQNNSSQAFNKNQPKNASKLSQKQPDEQNSSKSIPPNKKVIDNLTVPKSTEISNFTGKEPSSQKSIPPTRDSNKPVDNQFNSNNAFPKSSTQSNPFKDQPSPSGSQADFGDFGTPASNPWSAEPSVKQQDKSKQSSVNVSISEVQSDQQRTADKRPNIMAPYQSQGETVTKDSFKLKLQEPSFYPTTAAETAGGNPFFAKSGDSFKPQNPKINFESSKLQSYNPPIQDSAYQTNPFDPTPKKPSALFNRDTFQPSEEQLRQLQLIASNLRVQIPKNNGSENQHEISKMSNPFDISENPFDNYSVKTDTVNRKASEQTFNKEAVVSKQPNNGLPGIKQSDPTKGDEEFLSGRFGGVLESAGRAHVSHEAQESYINPTSINQKMHKQQPVEPKNILRDSTHLDLVPISSGFEADPFQPAPQNPFDQKSVYAEDPFQASRSSGSVQNRDSFYNPDIVIVAPSQEQFQKPFDSFREPSQGMAQNTNKAQKFPEVQPTMRTNGILDEIGMTESRHDFGKIYQPQAVQKTRPETIETSFKGFDDFEAIRDSVRSPSQGSITQSQNKPARNSNESNFFGNVATEHKMSITADFNGMFAEVVKPSNSFLAQSMSPKSVNAVKPQVPSNFNAMEGSLNQKGFPNMIPQASQSSTPKQNPLPTAELKPASVFNFDDFSAQRPSVPASNVGDINFSDFGDAKDASSLRSSRRVENNTVDFDMFMKGINLRGNSEKSQMPHPFDTTKKSVESDFRLKGDEKKQEYSRNTIGEKKEDHLFDLPPMSNQSLSNKPNQIFNFQSVPPSLPERQSQESSQQKGFGQIGNTRLNMQQMVSSFKRSNSNTNQVAICFEGDASQSKTPLSNTQAPKKQTDSPRVFQHFPIINKDSEESYKQKGNDKRSSLMQPAIVSWGHFPEAENSSVRSQSERQSIKERINNGFEIQFRGREPGYSSRRAPSSSPAFASETVRGSLNDIEGPEQIVTIISSNGGNSLPVNLPMISTSTEQLKQVLASKQSRYETAKLKLQVLKAKQAAQKAKYQSKITFLDELTQQRNEFAEMLQQIRSSNEHRRRIINAMNENLSNVKVLSIQARKANAQLHTLLVKQSYSISNPQKVKAKLEAFNRAIQQRRYEDHYRSAIL